MTHVSIETMTEKLPSLSMPEYGLFLLEAIARLKETVRSFFFQVMLSQYCCPKCNGALIMVGTSLSRCEQCGILIDPTIAFQRCNQCNGKVTKKTYHYHCKACKRVVKSRFLFDEKVFDKAYFCQLMKQSRQRKEKKKCHIQAILRESRSEVFIHKECPHFREIDGLSNALDAMINTPIPQELLLTVTKAKEFNLKRYKQHILTCLQEVYEIFFDDIRPLLNNTKKDRAFRFVALIFMSHWGEVELIQYGDKLVVEKGETHS